MKSWLRFVAILLLSALVSAGCGMTSKDVKRIDRTLGGLGPMLRSRISAEQFAKVGLGTARRDVVTTLRATPMEGLRASAACLHFADLRKPEDPAWFVFCFDAQGALVNKHLSRAPLPTQTPRKSN